MADENKFAILAIRNGEVHGICGISDDEVLRDCVAEWALDPTVECMIRVPIAIARKSFDATEADIRQMLAELANG